MVEERRSPKLFILLFIAAVMPCFGFTVAWELPLQFSSTSITGNSIYYEAYLGEHSSATDGFDWLYDAIAMSPYGNPNYLMAYFYHNNWTPNNGNYAKDIRSATVVQKTWALTLLRNGNTNNNYLLSWQIPPLMPDYYRPKLLFGASTLDMRNQSSHSFTTTASSTTCSIRLDINTGMPYLLALLPELDFSDNLPRYLRLADYFAVLNGSLNYSISANEHLEQSLQTINGSVFWKLAPLPGWHGSTTVTLNAIGSGGTKSLNIPVNRDSTNNPPVYDDAGRQLEIMQNQQLLFSWEDQFSDADLDAISVQIQASADISIQPDYALQQALISPNPGFKGSAELLLLLSDGTIEVSYPIPITVLPSIPQAVQNIRLIPNSAGELSCNWDAVSTDVYGLPIRDVFYRLRAYPNPQCSGEPQLSLDSDLPAVVFPDGWDRMFFRISVVNE